MKLTLYRVYYSGAMALILMGMLFGISACTSSSGDPVTPPSEDPVTPPCEAGISTDLGIVGQDLDIVICGENFQAGSNVAMIPNIYRESRVLASLTFLDGYVNVMAQSGDMVYYASEGSGFDVIDLQDPTTPQIIGHTDLPWTYYSDMVIIDGVAYIAGNEGVQMVDVFDPKNPQLIGRLVTADYDLKYTRYVRVSGSIAFVVVSGGNSDQDQSFPNHALYAIDISDIANCRILGLIILPEYYRGFEIQDGLALFSYSNGLIGIDISNPEFLEVTDTIEIDEAGGFCIFNQAVFIVGGRSNTGARDKIYAINISDPWNMKIDSQTSAPDDMYSTRITVSGSSLFLLLSSDIWKIDIRELTKMQIVGNVSTFDLNGSNDQIFIKDDVAFISTADRVDEVGEFYVIDIGDMEDPVARLEGIAGAVTTPNATDMILTQNTLYASQGNLGISIIDVSDPEQPKRIDDQSIFEPVAAMAVSGHTLFVGSEDSIRIYSVLDPQHPILLSSLNLPDENVLLLAPMNKVLFAGANTCESGCWAKDDCYYYCDNYLRAIDVSDPNNPTLMGSVPVSADNSTNLIISDRTGYLSGYSVGYMPDYGAISWSENCVVNLNDQFYPEIITTLMDGSLIDQNVSNDTLFMTTESDDFADISESWLVALDVNDPLNVKEISRLSIPSVGIGSLYMNTVYLLSYSYDAENYDRHLGIYAMDISDPNNMRLITKMPLPQSLADIWDIKDLVVSGNLAYLAADNSGVIILPLPLGAKNVSVDSSSKISATLPGPKIPGSYTIKVIDESGNETTVGTVTYIR